jgi:carotenoid cleavage dioxygenase-like enzyme
MGFDTLGGTLGLQMSAHPKYDQRTKETFFHGKDLSSSKFHVGRIQDSKLQEQADLPGIADGFQHDMFITKANNSLCLDHPCLKTFFLPLES